MAFPQLWKSRKARTTRTTTARLSVHVLEERAVPTLNVATIYGVSTGPGVDTTVKVFLPNGTLLSTFKPYPLPGNTFFGGGCTTSVGDIDGDGFADVVTGAGMGGGPHVKVFDGEDIMNGSSNPAVIKQFFPFESTFLGGVNVAVGDVNGDGLQDVIASRGPGAVTQVIAFSNGNQGQQLMNFQPYVTSFLGGATVATGDFGGDQVKDEIVTGAQQNGAPRVRVWANNFNANPLLAATRLAQFYAYDQNLTCGVNVSGGYFSNNRDPSDFLYADIVTGAGQTGGPHVRVWRLLDAINDPQGNPDWQYFNAANSFPYVATFNGGVRVGHVRNGQFDDFLTGAGPTGGPHLKNFNSTSVTDLETYVPTLDFQAFPFDPAFTGGIYVS